MNEIDIKRHSFDMAKNRLKEFSEKTEAQLEINKVQTEGGFLGLGDHKVTGYELNRRLETIQGHFIAINTTNNKVIKEFREIYNALDVLDKDYIASIIANVKAIEKTSNDVRVQQGTLKQHNEKLMNQQCKLDAHQVEIEKNVENISKIVTTLKVFKEKLEGYKHLTDIDKIWNDCKSIHNEIRVVSESITKFSKKTTEDIATANNKNKALSEQVNRDIHTLHNEAKSFKEFFSDLSEKLETTTDLLYNQLPIIKETSFYIELLNNMEHLHDVDFIWEDTKQIRENIVTIENSLQNIKMDILHMEEDIDKIDSFVFMMENYKHLQNVDNMWDDIDICKKNIEKIKEDIQTQQNELDNLAIISETHTESISSLSKKLIDAERYAEDSRNQIAKLKDFKEEVSALNHLMEVDEIWKQTKEHQIRINQVEQEGMAHTDKLNELEQADSKMCERITSNTHEISMLKEYKDKLNKISHLEDVDGMWNNIEDHISKLNECEKRDVELADKILENKEEIGICKKNIEKIKEDIQTQQNELDNLATISETHTESISGLSKKLIDAERYAEDSRNQIAKLEDFKEEVSALNHLMEVDEIWKQTVDHTSKLIECEKRDAEITDVINKNKEEVNANIAEAVQAANIAIETLTKKVKYAYWIAGGSAGLAIVELILLLVKVI